MQLWIQHVSLPRPPGSGDETRAYYGGLLGLTEIPVPDSTAYLDLIWYQVGELELHLFAEALCDDPSGRHFCLELRDRRELIELKDKLVAGGYVTWDPEPIAGRPRFFCRDPFRNIIEFTTIEDDYLKVEGRKA
jgi:hypothetical protein